VKKEVGSNVNGAQVHSEIHESVIRHQGVEEASSELLPYRGMALARRRKESPRKRCEKFKKRGSILARKEDLGKTSNTTGIAKGGEGGRGKADHGGTL